MKKSKLMAFGLSIAAIFSFMSESAQCDVIGDTYDLGATMFSNAGGGVFIDDGPASLTFDGTTKVLGNLVFGNAGDEVIIQETQVVTGNEFVVTVFVFAQDAAGNFTTWAADGTTFDNDGDGGIGTPEVPFEVPQFQIATGNGGSDTLDVDTGGDTYAFVESEALLVAFDGAGAASIFTFGDGPTAASGPSGNFTAGVAFNAGPDLAEPVGALGGLEFTGFGFTWTYTLTAAVPEPSSAAGLMFLGLAGLGYRRRKN